LKPVVREIAARTVLNDSKLGDYSLNCYTGCTHACVYCYARFMQRFHPHEEPWGAFVDIKVNAVECLVKQLRRAKPGHVFMSSACDCYQPLEHEWRLTRRCSELLMHYGFQVNVLTKSSLVLEDLPMYAEGKLARIGVTITTPDEAAAHIWEPGASPVAQRIAVLKAAKAAGIETSVMFGPILPGVSDDDASLDGLFAIAAETEVDNVWTDCLNARPKVWPSIAGMLNRRFPALLPLYRKVLFNDAFREKYVEDLQKRIRAAAARHKVLRRMDGA
jgi:DNA repair photolyase